MTVFRLPTSAGTWTVSGSVGPISGGAPVAVTFSS